MDRSSTNVNRREFLTLAAQVGLGTALAPTLAACAPAGPTYDDQVKRVWEHPLKTGGNVNSQLAEIVRYATFAPSGHNTQPWKFALKDNTVRMLPDLMRRLAIVDPDDRELYISLGCALENLVIAAQQMSYDNETNYFFIGRSNGSDQTEKDAKNIRSSAGMLLFVSDRNDKSAWIETGRAYERYALTATTLNIKSAFLNQPIEIPALCSQLQARFNLASAHPQLLLRFGYSQAMPRSLRRPVEMILA